MRVFVAAASGAIGTRLVAHSWIEATVGPIRPWHFPIAGDGA